MKETRIQNFYGFPIAYFLTRIVASDIQAQPPSLYPFASTTPTPQPGVRSLNLLLPWFRGALCLSQSLAWSMLSSAAGRARAHTPPQTVPGMWKSSEEGCRVCLEWPRGRPGSAAVGREALKHPGGLIRLKVGDIRGSTSCSKADSFIYSYLACP